MFKQIDAVAKKKLYLNFNKENEKAYPMDVDFYINLDGCDVDMQTGLVVTQNGNYVGGYYIDVIRDDAHYPATGFYLETNSKILFNGEALNETTRRKITEDDGIVICGEDYNCLFYPIIEDENEYYMEYSKENNTVGIVSTYNGIVKSESRVMTKYGFSFSRNMDFIKDNAELTFDDVCCLNRSMGCACIVNEKGELR